jgi:hypothetical protein
LIGVLNTLLKILDVSLESAVANPLTPVSPLPSPTNLVAVTIPLAASAVIAVPTVTDV